MAKVHGPLFSLKATGTFGRTLTFQTRAGSTAVFLPVSPYDPQTAKQLAIRAYMAQGVSYWQSLSAPYKALWNAFIN